MMMNQYGLSKRYKEFRMLQSWSEMMGPMVAKRTDDLFIRNGSLYVKLKSAALRNELGFEKQKIIRMLNEKAGQNIIDDIIFQ